MHRDVLPHVIFSPGQLAISLAKKLGEHDVEVVFFCPGPLDLDLKQVNADLSYFEKELAARGDTYMQLLKKHPFTFITLARQVQSELIARAYQMANDDELDIVHVYANEEDTALPFRRFCKKPVVFTHHDPYNFLVKYRSVFPKYADLSWISTSYAQRTTMPTGTSWLANVYHGLNPAEWEPRYAEGNYIAYLGRIVEPKGVHLAIEAVKKYNAACPAKTLKLKIAGKHYGGDGKDSYWTKKIAPLLDDEIEYIGFLGTRQAKQEFLGNAAALIVPSVFDEPFGMVIIEALACGTPVIGLESGAIPELVRHGKTGFVVKKYKDESRTAGGLADAVKKISSIDRKLCRQNLENNFTLEKMCLGHIAAYQKALGSSSYRSGAGNDA